MGMWEFLDKFKRRKEQEELETSKGAASGPFKNVEPHLEGKMDPEAGAVDKIKDSDPLNMQNPIPNDEAKRLEQQKLSLGLQLPEALDAQASSSLDVSRLILSSTVPDHQVASIILSNIFLIPKNFKSYDDSWPAYQRELETAKEIKIALIERKFREDMKSIKGKRKKLKYKYFEKLKEERTVTQRYFDDFQKIVSVYIQKIRIEIIPLEKEITESKHKLNETKQKIYLVKKQQLEQMDKYNNLLQSNIKILGGIKNGLKNVLSLKKIWHAAHVVASYVLAFFGATEIVKTEVFKNFIYDKLSKLSSISDFLMNNFTIVQGISAGIVFLVSVGMYDKFVIDYLKRRQAKKEMERLAKQDQELNDQLEALNKKISELKGNKSETIKDFIIEAEQNILYFFQDYESNMNRLDKQRFEEPN